MESGERAHLHEAMGRMKSGLVVTPPVLNAWGAARSTPGAWLTVAYDPTAKDTVVLKEAGAGGWPACAASLADDAIAFGAFAFTLGAQHRVAFFSWVGPGVSPLKRGKVPLQRGAVYAAFEGVCADLSFAERELLAPAAVVAQLSRLLTGRGDVVL